MRLTRPRAHANYHCTQLKCFFVAFENIMNKYSIKLSVSPPHIRCGCVRACFFPLLPHQKALPASFPPPFCGPKIHFDHNRNVITSHGNGNIRRTIDIVRAAVVHKSRNFACETERKGFCSMRICVRLCVWALCEC